MAAAAQKAPTREIGQTLYAGLPTWAGLSSGIAESREYVPELTWPTSIETLERMGTDSQLSALMRGTFLPITRWLWAIDPNEAPPAMVDAVCREFNLHRKDIALEALRTGRSAPIGRTKNRFSFSKHQRDAFRALGNGNYYFEQWGRIEQDGLALGAPQAPFWHLRKLLALPPWTIGEIKVAEDGGLVHVKQQLGLDSPTIPVTQLVGYVWDQGPGDWLGTSMFRSCYREWLLKDRLLRVDAVNHEKAGGVFINEAPADATPAEIEALAVMAAAVRTGGGGAVPAGTDPRFFRASGSDVIASINRHDEAMARAFLLMIIQLGQTQSGSRAVGDNFQDLSAYVQEAIAIWFADTFNEHVVEDFCDWNYGEQEFVPRLVFIRPEDDDPTADLEAGIDDGTIAADPDTVELVKAGKKGSARRGRLRAARAATASPIPLPDRDLRRQPYDHEIRAAVDFAAIDEAWQDTVDELVSEWQAVRTAQIGELVQLIEGAVGNLETLAAIQATKAGADLIEPRLEAALTAGVAEAVGEAIRQGVAATTPDVTDLQPIIAARAGALEQLLARSLSEAAGRKAVSLTGGAITAVEVASEVQAHLEQLTDAFLVDQFGGAISAAQNSGRVAVMAANGPSRVYASELLDVSTCDPCAARDGHEYSSLEAASKDYPGGGYKECAGGPRCRGTLVAVYDEAVPTA